ncbi:metallophosphoesterase [Candidatus Woesearchaeota archaeon]|nr:metallophosphoesterase [Candidatus Woesearchaeota archaeon]
MEISPHLRIIGLALWWEAEKLLIINDLHIGYEEALQQKGVLVPRFQLREIQQMLQQIFQHVQPEMLIINGDLKHEFGRILRQEWTEILAFFDFLAEHTKKIVLIKGNHDVIIGPLAERKGVEVVKELRIGDTLIIHGDAVVQTDAKRLIIGHEHPAVTLREGSKREKYKCFLRGKWKRKELIVMPSFNPLLEGTDILKEQLLSPFLTEIKDFDVFIVGKENAFAFGKVGGLKSKEML